MTTQWYVVVERLDMQDNPLPAYALGPLDEKTALQELDSDSGIAYCWLTIDAKNENYQAIECVMTQNIPDNAIIIHPN